MGSFEGLGFLLMAPKSTYIVEFRVSMFGVILMIMTWGSISHNSNYG